MKKSLRLAVIGSLAVTGMFIGSVASAATFNFADMASEPGDPNYFGEMGFSTLTVTVDGITVNATGTDNADYLTYLADPGSYAGSLNNYSAYLDGISSGRKAGLGVCKVLTSGDQCDPSSDDNATAGEVLILDFGQELTISDLFFRDAQHFTFPDNTTEDFSLFIDGSFVGIFTYGSPLLSSFTGTEFAFAADDFSDGRFVADNDQFYISNVSAVPLPAAVWLLGSALGGLGFMRRRNTK